MRIVKQYGLSIILLVIGLVVDNLEVFQNKKYTLFIYIVALYPIVPPLIKEWWQCIKEKVYFNEFTLMLVACFGALLIGEYPEAVAILLLYCIGEELQHSAVHKAKNQITDMLRLKKKKIQIKRGDKLQIKNVEEINIGDKCILNAGDQLPIDAILLEKEAYFNTISLTGESLPRCFYKGDTLNAGFIIENKSVEVEAISTCKENTLTKLLFLVQKASENKAPTERLIRKIAKVYTPSLFIFALVYPFIYWGFSTIFSFSFTWIEAINNALTCLVIACPCALVIGIPLTYFLSIGVASKKGILIKGGNVIDNLKHINAVAFDKTGTLTKGKFTIVETLWNESLTEKQQKNILTLIENLEQRSNHPLAKSIVQYINSPKEHNVEWSNVVEKVGRGMKGECEYGVFSIGNKKMFMEENIIIPRCFLENNTYTIIYFALNGKLIGLFKLQDKLKEGVEKITRELNKLKIKTTALLSGDNEETTKKIAQKLQFTTYKAQLLPADKLQFVNQWKTENKKVMFVGDGLNDAPVLATANVGVAMGKIGSDLSVETADIVLQNDKVESIGIILKLGKKTNRLVWQNISFALGAKIGVLILGILGMTNMWMAVFADTGIALLVILNSLRIRR